MIGRWTATIALALLGAGGIGALAGSFNPDHFMLTAIVFAACTVTPLGALGWMVFLMPKTPESAEDNVEHHWAAKAAGGAFTDLIVLLSAGLAAVSISGIALDTPMVLLVLLTVAMSDFGLRYFLLERQAR